MKNRIVFRILGALASALIIVSVFVPFVSVTGYSQSLWQTYESINTLYLPIMIIVFGAIGILSFAINIKTELAYTSTGALIFFLITQTIPVIEQDMFDTFSMGYYFLVIGTIVTGIMAFICNLRKKTKIEDTSNSIEKDSEQISVIEQIDKLYDDQSPVIGNVNEASSDIIQPIPLQNMEQSIQPIEQLQPVENIDLNVNQDINQNNISTINNNNLETEVSSLSIDNSQPQIQNPVMQEFETPQVPTANPVVQEFEVPQVPTANPVVQEFEVPQVPTANPVVQEFEVPQVPIANPVVQEFETPQTLASNPTVQEFGTTNSAVNNPINQDLPQTNEVQPLNNLQTNNDGQKVDVMASPQQTNNNSNLDIFG